jgi:hypothetical protein
MRVRVLVFVGLLAASLLASAANAQVITSATVNYQQNTLTISGSGFPTSAVVYFARQFRMTGQFVSAQRIDCVFPPGVQASTFFPGGYMLDIQFPGVPDIFFDVAIGAPESSVATLQQQVASLQRLVTALRTSTDQLQSEVTALQTSNSQLQASVTALLTSNSQLQNEFGSLRTLLVSKVFPAIGALQNNSVIALNGKLSLAPDGTTARFTGVNVQIVNGAGRTGSINGTGNLIVGYNETDPSNSLQICSNGAYADQTTCMTNGGVWGANQHAGSHNVVIGSQHSYTQYGGLVAGFNNAITNGYVSVSAGTFNVARGLESAVGGGANNAASGAASSITGGAANLASNAFSSVTGGIGNTASGPYSTVSGGEASTASGADSSVSGGDHNFASGTASGVSGGSDNGASGDYSTVSGGQSNTASGEFSSVSGGASRTAPGLDNWAAGLLFQAQ